MNRQTLSTFVKLAVGAAVLAGSAAKADNFLFHVDLNTAALVSAANGPFFLDFQLNQGTGTLSNTVALSNFTFTGGSASGSASLFGNASGNFGSGFSLVDSTSSPFNEAFQGFTASTTDIQFDVSVTRNSPGSTPDAFIVSILDSEAGNPQITTNAPDSVSMVALNIGTNNTIANVGAFTSTAPAGATATVTAVPEPSSFVAMAGGIGMLLGFRRKRR
jgi:hypothetical protein